MKDYNKNLFKRKLCLFLLMSVFLFISNSVRAENYPYRSDYLWVTVPDHPDWLYETGEKATVEIQLYKYGVPCDCMLDYYLSDDMQEPDKKGSVKLENGRAKLSIGTRQKPGFRDLTLNFSDNGTVVSHHVKVGFSVNKLVPYTQEPSDFMTFWNSNINEMRKMPLRYTKELAKEYCTDKIDCYLIKLLIDKEGHSMYGYLFYPKDAKAGSCPAVLCPPGAGVKTIKEPLRHKYYAENGFVRFEIEIHGLDPRLPKATFDDLSHAFNANNGGYLENGVDHRDRYYMKHVYLGLIRCIDLLASLPEWDGRNMAVQGGSQGGALALVTAGLDKRITQCVVNHPALSDMCAYMDKGRTGGYPHFNKMDNVLTPNNAKTLSYYDVVNFARHVVSPVYMTWGYNDNTCPPTTSYVVWNTLKCKKESLITPINEHWTSDATEFGQMQWIKSHLLK